MNARLLNSDAAAPVIILLVIMVLAFAWSESAHRGSGAQSMDPGPAAAGREAGAQPRAAVVAPDL